jgi:hypothetical protein
VVDTLESTVPCDVCSSDRQLQCAGAAQGAGGAAARIAVEALVARTDPAGADREATHWDREGDTAAAGTADVGDQPCRVAVLAAAVEGAQRSSGVR